MDSKNNSKKVTAIIPAYNEEKRIGKVLDVVVKHPYFDEVIVVDDGSTDGTSEIVEKYNIKYLKNKFNMGKGYSMDLGVNMAKNEIIFFADADVIGLTPEIINQIIDPVIKGKVDMFIGMRNRIIYYSRFVLFFVPLLGGERALTKELWQKVPSYYKHRFRVETGLNFYAHYCGQGFSFKIFDGMKQVIKEKKYGMLRGFKQRIFMFANIISAQAKLYLIDIPKSNPSRSIFDFYKKYKYLEKNYD